MEIEKGRKKRDKAKKWPLLAFTMFRDSETMVLKLTVCNGVVSMEAADGDGGNGGGGGGKGIY